MLGGLASYGAAMEGLAIGSRLTPDDAQGAFLLQGSESVRMHLKKGQCGQRKTIVTVKL